MLGARAAIVLMREDVVKLRREMAAVRQLVTSCELKTHSLVYRELTCTMHGLLQF